LLLLFLGAYAAAMRALLDVSDITNDDDANQRDLIYSYLHVGLLVLGTVVGFLLGKWYNGLGFAFATLFLITILLGMAFLQIGSYELACRGHNDLIRHWQC